MSDCDYLGANRLGLLLIPAQVSSAFPHSSRIHPSPHPRLTLLPLRAAGPLLLIPAKIAYDLVEERATGVKHLQVLMGVSSREPPCAPFEIPAPRSTPRSIDNHCFPPRHDIPLREV